MTTPRPNLRRLPPLDPHERAMREMPVVPPAPVRPFNWLKLNVWLLAILIACWVAIAVIGVVSWWGVRP